MIMMMNVKDICVGSSCMQPRSRSYQILIHRLVLTDDKDGNEGMKEL